MIKVNYAIALSTVAMVFITWSFSKITEDVWEDNSILREKVRLLTETIVDLENTYNVDGINVIATIYHASRRQTDSTPNITADGTKFKTWKASSYRYVALSRDLLSRWGGPFNYGDYIVIEGTGDRDGVYQVRDTMNPKWTNRVDILTTNSRFKYNNITMYKYVDEEYLLTHNN